MQEMKGNFALFFDLAKLLFIHVPGGHHDRATKGPFKEKVTGRTIREVAINHAKVKGISL